MALLGICFTKDCRRRRDRNRDMRREDREDRIGLRQGGRTDRTVERQFGRSDRTFTRQTERSGRTTTRTGGRTDRELLRQQANVLETGFRTAPGATVPGAQIATGIGDAGTGLGAAAGGLAALFGGATAAGLIGPDADPAAALAGIDQGADPVRDTFINGVSDGVAIAGATLILGGVVFLATRR